ncbi:MAG: hypothetical protein Q9194_001507 [Teloschistes cf. exilis]
MERFCRSGARALNPRKAARPDRLLKSMKSSAAGRAPRNGRVLNTALDQSICPRASNSSVGLVHRAGRDPAHEYLVIPRILLFTGNKDKGKAASSRVNVADETHNGTAPCVYDL